MGRTSLDSFPISKNYTKFFEARRKIVPGGGGGTRTHKPFRAPVFKTGALPIRRTPPQLKTSKPGLQKNLQLSFHTTCILY